jgi:hypothetical protein
MLQQASWALWRSGSVVQQQARVMLPLPQLLAAAAAPRGVVGGAGCRPDAATAPGSQPGMVPVLLLLLPLPLQTVALHILGPGVVPLVLLLLQQQHQQLVVLGVRARTMGTPRSSSLQRCTC